MKKISELNVLGTNKSTNKPKSGALRLLLMLVAVVAMSGSVWG